MHREQAHRHPWHSPPKNRTQPIHRFTPLKEALMQRARNETKLNGNKNSIVAMAREWDETGAGMHAG